MHGAGAEEPNTHREPLASASWLTKTHKELGTTTSRTSDDSDRTSGGIAAKNFRHRHLHGVHVLPDTHGGSHEMWRGDG